MSAYCAFMRLLPCVAPHVDHQHVLRLEGLLLPRALLPATHELLLLAVDVVVVDVLWRQTDCRQSSRFCSVSTKEKTMQADAKEEAADSCVVPSRTRCLSGVRAGTFDTLTSLCHPLQLTAAMPLSAGDKSYKGSVCFFRLHLCSRFSRKRNFSNQEKDLSSFISLHGSGSQGSSFLCDALTFKHAESFDLRGLRRSKDGTAAAHRSVTSQHVQPNTFGCSQT